MLLLIRTLSIVFYFVIACISCIFSSAAISIPNLIEQQGANSSQTPTYCQVHSTTKINYDLGGCCAECLLESADRAMETTPESLSHQKTTDNTVNNTETSPRSSPSHSHNLNLNLSPNSPFSQIREQNELTQEQEERRLSISSNIFGNPDYLFDSDGDD